jgi:ribosomal protein S18 acetylase RimI-like enzyme
MDIMETIIRPYEEKDFMEMLKVTMELWDLKMKPYTKKGIDINTSIIIDTGTIPRRINEGVIVAESEGHIAGVAHLDYLGKRVGKADKLCVFKLIKKYGFIRLLKVRQMGLFFEHKIKVDELHIHGIVVSSRFQNMGIGSKLFKEIENIAEKKNLKNITLEVLDSNILAYNLYKRLGFIDVSKSVFSKQQQQYFKSNSHIYMMKILDENNKNRE